MNLSRSVAIALLFALAPSLAVAQTDPIKTAERLNKKAMEDYDLLEFDSARQTLQSALNKLREEGQDETKTAAKVYVSLGMVYISGFKDRSRGVQQFVEALKIDGNTALDPERATPELQEAFEEARSKAPKNAKPVETEAPPVVEEKEVTGGLQHNPIDEAKAGQEIAIEATMGADVTASKVYLFYRPGGVEDFQSVPMVQASKGRYKATIPGDAVSGKALQYYLEARDARNRPVTAAGSAASPYIITVEQPLVDHSARPGGEDPLAHENWIRKERNDKGRGFGRIFMNLMVGTGFGVEVEGNQFEVAYQYHSADGTHMDAKGAQIGYFRPLTVGGTGLALAPIHGVFEAGVNINKHWSLSGMVRVQGTLINNADSSSVCPAPGDTSVFGCTTKVSVAPAGMARLRYTFLEGRFKPALHLGLGGGFIRHVLNVTEAGHHLDDPPLTDAGTAQFYYPSDEAVAQNPGLLNGRKDPKSVPGAPSKSTQNFVCPTYPETCYDTIKMGYVLAAVGFNLYYDLATWRNGGFGVLLDTDVILGFGDQFGLNIDVSVGIGAHFM